MSTISSTSSSPDLSKLDPAAQQALQGIKISSNKQTLSQEDFLKLLTQQLQNQDPLKPMDDAQFMGQMAQFSTLQATNDLNANFTKFNQKQTLNSTQQLIGMNVSLTDESGNGVTGLVTQVKVVSGVPQIVINGTAYTTDNITSISLPNTSGANASAN